ncbi:MAG: O-acetylhomoserine sulfhydrylase [Bacteroidetes bacterium GWF2_42_66]|nr:MAG: O-acetylhomoserine sulfhydrylase [Bacteroidetes bacterium GWA2_42_15]OFY01397.1 MAG: O-acetylhomoserine sulfhydrylase [Bacteroidetes bacterium GWE2_42_39]OFY42239.1 MAG: O-acetylhomoserine sulfhydrylase [Bacteroidetes bacterium GWF2_42_66]HBL77863.1 O-acetylhomoserine sulfhydrylase [Prolixibacteraceae bacterium]HCR91008.1 O-acetylhomoserine sulfhydrylase [Prolixibacteraceae bacterium]
MKRKSFTTRSLNVPYAKNDPHRALSMPIYNSVAFEFETAEDIAANFRGELPAHAYSRSGNPTVEYFEHKLKALTGAHQALAVASGMAAISATIMAVSKAGDNIVSGKNLFGHTTALFAQSLNSFGLETRFADLNFPEKIEKLIDENTRAIYFETVTNPQLEIADIEKLSAVAKKHGLLLIADSTVTPPVSFHAASFGVDVELMSTTKFISGGATSVGGAVIDYGTYDWTLNPNTREFSERFGKDAFIARLRKNYFRNFGACMSPQIAQLQIAGLDILELRFERCYQNTMVLGEFLLKHKKVARVDYPGLPSSPYYRLALKQFEGKPGAILTFDLESQEECFRFMNRLKIIRRATNLNDNKSLIIHPYSTIYNEFTELQRAEMGIRNTMMRLSVGIEGADDLMEDIEQALS